MKVDIILESVLNQSFGKYITQGPLVSTKLKIDNRLARDHCDDVSEKCDSRNQHREILPSERCEVFFYYSCE